MTVCDLPGNFGDVLVKGSSHIIIIAEDEGFLQLESASYYVARVLLRKSLRLLHSEFMFEKKFLVV